MPRYLVTTQRAVRGIAATAKDAVGAESGVKLVNSEHPDMITIEASEQAAEALRQRLKDTHFVEPEIRRSLH
jgi:hypothetical protein